MRFDRGIQLFALAGFVLAFWPFILTGCGGDGVGATCHTYSHCAYGLHCDDSSKCACTPDNVPCSDNSSCPGGISCRDGVCEVALECKGDGSVRDPIPDLSVADLAPVPAAHPCWIALQNGEKTENGCPSITTADGCRLLATVYRECSMDWQKGTGAACAEAIEACKADK